MICAPRKIPTERTRIGSLGTLADILGITLLHDMCSIEAGDRAAVRGGGSSASSLSDLFPHPSPFPRREAFGLPPGRLEAGGRSSSEYHLIIISRDLISNHIIWKLLSPSRCGSWCCSLIEGIELSGYARCVPGCPFEPALLFVRNALFRDNKRVVAFEPPGWSRKRFRLID